MCTEYKSECPIKSPLRWFDYIMKIYEDWIAEEIHERRKNEFRKNRRLIKSWLSVIEKIVKKKEVICLKNTSDESKDGW